MGTQGGGPPNKTQTLDAAAFTDMDAYNNAVGALYDLGYKFAYNVPGKTWTVFEGYKKGK